MKYLLVLLLGLFLYSCDSPVDSTPVKSGYVLKVGYFKDNIFQRIETDNLSFEHTADGTFRLGYMNLTIPDSTISDIGIYVQ